MLDSNAQLIISDECNVQNIRCMNINCLKNFSGDWTINAIRSNKERIAYIMYTSGSTGYPKGVKITYANLMNLIFAFNHIIYNYMPVGTKVAVVASFSFDSSVKQIYCSLFYGMCLIIASTMDKMLGRKLVDFWNKNGIEVTDITPSHIPLIAASKKISFVKIYLVGGEKLYWNNVRMLKACSSNECKIINLYGPTECCVDASFYEIKNDTLEYEEDIPIGKALQGTEIILLDEYNNEIVESGVKGELCILGNQVGAGYLNIVSKRFFYRNGERAFKTGDYGFFDRNLCLHIIGRMDGQVKINGNRVELEEVKIALIRVVKSSKVTVLYDISVGGLIGIMDCKTELRYSDIILELRKYIENYKIPKKIYNIPSFPLNENGKLDINKIKKLIGEKYEL